MWAVTIEHRFPLIYIKNDGVDLTTLRPIIVDGASLTVVENTSSHEILELPLPIPFGDEEILRKAKVSYPCDIRAGQWHLSIQAAFDAPVLHTPALHRYYHWLMPRNLNNVLSQTNLTSFSNTTNINFAYSKGPPAF